MWFWNYGIFLVMEITEFQEFPCGDVEALGRLHNTWVNLTMLLLSVSSFHGKITIQNFISKFSYNISNNCSADKKTFLWNHSGSNKLNYDIFLRRIVHGTFDAKLTFFTKVMNFVLLKSYCDIVNVLYSKQLSASVTIIKQHFWHAVQDVHLLKTLLCL